MLPCGYNAAPIQFGSKNNIKNIKKNKTIKHRKNISAIKDVINNINNYSSITSSDDDNEKNNFKPLDFSPPKMEKIHKKTEPFTNNATKLKEMEQNMRKLNAERERYESHYHQEVEPNHQTISNTYENKELLQKLNKIIVMLENSKDQKSKYVTEELVLYSFLGIFIIYIVDSFAKVGKYVR